MTPPQDPPGGNKGGSGQGPVDDPTGEEAMIAWQDALDSVVAGRPGDAVCPFCRHRPLTVEQIDFATRVSCSKCRRFVQGTFS